MSAEELILYHYGEACNQASIEQHLSACQSCCAEQSALANVLAAVDAVPVPDRADTYAEEVWQRLRPRLAVQAPVPRSLGDRIASGLAGIFTPRRWVPAGAVAALVVLAFLAGRFWPRHETQVAERGVSAQARDRILLVAVGDHLERSQMVLVELVNAHEPRRKGEIDISAERERAQDLVAANRLYRLTAARAGEESLASVLDDLELVLVDIAHRPSKVSSAEFEELRKRIEAQGIIFKVRVIDSQVQERERAVTPEPAPAPGSKI